MSHVDCLSRSPFEEPSTEEEDELPTDLETKTVLVIKAKYDEAVAMQAIDGEIVERVAIFKKPKDAWTVREKNLVEGFVMQEGLLMKRLEDRESGKEGGVKK